MILFRRWSDQGAFTGEMTSIHVRFSKHGTRWFDGKNINKGFDQDNFGYLYEDSLCSAYESEDSDDSSDAIE